MSNVFFLSRVDALVGYRNVSSSIFFRLHLPWTLSARFDTIPGPVHGGGMQAKFPSGDLGFSASLFPLLLLGVWLDPESWWFVVSGLGVFPFPGPLLGFWGFVGFAPWSLLAQPSALFCYTRHMLR